MRSMRRYCGRMEFVDVCPECREKLRSGARIKELEDACSELNIKRGSGG
jgi:hypothetical protein